MKNKLILIFAAIIFFTSCNADSNLTIDEKNSAVDHFDTANFLIEIAEFDTVMYNNPSKSDIITAAGLFEQYSVLFPNSDKAAIYLLKASDLQRVLGKHNKSLILIDQIIENHPNFSELENVYYNRADRADDMRDTVLAKMYYNDFIIRYPESDFVPSAQERMKNISLSLEELIEKFEKMNQ